MQTNCACAAGDLEHLSCLAVKFTEGSIEYDVKKNLLKNNS